MDEAVEKKPKEKKAKKPRAKKERPEGSVTRPRLPKYPDSDLITVLKPESKSRGAHDRFMLYSTGMTVRQYVDKVKETYDRTEGQTFADMRWDQDHKFIHIGPVVIDIPQAQQAAE